MQPGRSNSELTEPEAALVDVVRLVARGDAEAVPRRMRRWLSSNAARKRGLGEPLRASLLAALEETPKPPGRRAGPTAPPAAPPPAKTATPAEQPVLDAHARQAVDAIVAERERAEALAAVGLEPTSRLLLSGPPGVGKSMTAAWIADRVGLPLIRVEPAAVITSLLGESARNLVDALDAARAEPCVLLLDEVDAFAKRRDDAHDVGELKRLVTTLLVELDRWPARSLLVAATNHPNLLDHALARRFELRLELALPDLDARSLLAQRTLGSAGMTPAPRTLDAFAALTDGWNAADVRHAVRRAARRVVVADEGLDMALVSAALPEDPSAMSRDERRSFAEVASRHGMTWRAIGATLSVSHSAVGRMLAHTASSDGAGDPVAA